MIVKSYGKVLEYHGVVTKVDEGGEAVYNTQVVGVLSNYISTKYMKRLRSVSMHRENAIRVTYAAFARHLTLGVGAKELVSLALACSSRKEHYEKLVEALNEKDGKFTLNTNSILFEWAYDIIGIQYHNIQFPQNVQNLTRYPGFVQLYANLQTQGCELCRASQEIEPVYGLVLCPKCRVGRGFLYQESNHYTKLGIKCRCGGDAVREYGLQRVMCEKCYFDYRLHIYGDVKVEDEAVTQDTVEMVTCKGCQKQVTKNDIAPGSEFCALCYEEIYHHGEIESCDACNRSFATDDLIKTPMGTLCTDCSTFYGGYSTGWI